MFLWCFYYNGSEKVFEVFTAIVILKEINVNEPTTQCVITCFEHENNDSYWDVRCGTFQSMAWLWLWLIYYIYIYTHKFPNIWCHPGQCRVVFTPSAGLYSFVVPGVCCLTSFLWTAVFEMFRLEAAWRSLHLSASKARIELLLSSYFLTFDVTTSTVCAVQLALVEADKNSHSSSFLYFYSLNKIWLMWSPKRYLVK